MAQVLLLLKILITSPPHQYCVKDYSLTTVLLCPANSDKIANIVWKRRRLEPDAKYRVWYFCKSPFVLFRTSPPSLQICPSFLLRAPLSPSRLRFASSGLSLIQSDHARNTTTIVFADVRFLSHRHSKNLSIITLNALWGVKYRSQNSHEDVLWLGFTGSCSLPSTLILIID